MLEDKYLREIVEKSSRREITSSMVAEADTLRPLWGDRSPYLSDIFALKLKLDNQRLDNITLALNRRF